VCGVHCTVIGQANESNVAMQTALKSARFDGSLVDGTSCGAHQGHAPSATVHQSHESSCERGAVTALQPAVHCCCGNGTAPRGHPRVALQGHATFMRTFCRLSASASVVYCVSSRQPVLHGSTCCCCCCCCCCCRIVVVGLKNYILSTPFPQHIGFFLTSPITRPQQC
jgi:hypothetical protein